MTSTAPSVVYVLPDKVGGVASVVDNLLAHRTPGGSAHRVVLTDNSLDTDARLEGPMSGDGCRRVRYALPLENLHAVLRRLARAIPPGPGVLVANDWLELAMLSTHDVDRAVVSVAHGDHAHYYDLAERHEPLVDCFVAPTRRIETELIRRLPHRASAVVRLPHGVRIPAARRPPARGPLRLLYVGRMDESKGILDLPAIDHGLAERGVAVAWTLVGDGPHARALGARWRSRSPVTWTGVLPAPRVLATYQEHDVLVLPSRAEGLPVALLEAMAAGVVPAVTDLASGIPEVVEPGLNGHRVPVGDVARFAAAIADVARDRGRLEEMSRAARQTVVERFDIRARARDWEALYERWQDLRATRPRAVALGYGSRLDRPWIPNAAVYATRAARRWLQDRLA